MDDDGSGRWLAAAVFAILIATAALRARALRLDGAIAAVGIGTLLVGGAGWSAGLMLVAFFASSSGLSLLQARRRATTAEGHGGTRGHQRDAVQVLANGGVAAALAVTMIFVDDDHALALALAASIAAANADTWASEIGPLSRSAPRLVTTGRRASAGDDGAISALGTGAALAGAALIAAIAFLTTRWSSVGDPGFGQFVTVLVCGFGGAIVDSVLGATLQARWRMPGDQGSRQPRRLVETFQPDLVSGVRWITNDVVNVTSIMCGALCALLIGLA